MLATLLLGPWFKVVVILIVTDTGCCWAVAIPFKYGFKCSFGLAHLPNFAQQDYNRG